MRNLSVLKGALLMAAGVMVSASAYAAPTDLQKCGAANGKAYAGLFDAIAKEAARVCAQGSAMNAEDIKLATAAKATGKFDTQAGQGIDKYSAADCVIDLGAVPSPTVAGLMQTSGDAACSP